MVTLTVPEDSIRESGRCLLVPETWLSFVESCCSHDGVMGMLFLISLPIRETAALDSSASALVPISCRMHSCLSNIDQSLVLCV